MPAGPHRRRGEGVEWGRERPRSGTVRPPAGSLTPTCLVSVVLEEAGRMCAQIVTGCVTNYDRDRVPYARANDVMITARAVSYRRHNRWSFFVAHRSCSRA